MLNICPSIVDYTYTLSYHTTKSPAGTLWSSFIMDFELLANPDESLRLGLVVLIGSPPTR